MKKTTKQIGVTFRVSFEEDMEFTQQEWELIERCEQETHGYIDRNNNREVFGLISDQITSEPLEIIDEIEIDTTQF